MNTKTYTDAVSELNEELRRQREINAELLKALQAVLDADAHSEDAITAFQAARAAIAKATGSN